MNVPIAMICDDNYIAATGVTLSSIIASKQSSTNYIIYMLCASLSAEHEAMFHSFETDSVSIVILHVDADHFTSLVKNYETFTCPASPSALLKFELPNILNNEDKVIYLDVDIIVRTDLTELYLTSLDSNLVGAVVSSSSIYKKMYQYVDNYFNSGVMLLNLDLMRKENTMDALIGAKLEQSTERLMDQPAYNYVCDGRLKVLPLRYNLLAVILDRDHNRWTIDDINDRFDTSYVYPNDMFDDAAIIHFAGKEKPWINPCIRFAKDWYNIYHNLPSYFHTIPDYSEMLSKHITISLTSYPERINYIPEVIDCLLSQTVLADRIVLYLAKDQFPQLINSLPDMLRTYIDDGSILINWCDLDLKSHNDYFYAMQEYPDDVIITVDDDEYLPETAIEELMLCWFKCPQAVSARQTYLITFDINNRVLPYQDWIVAYNLVLQTPSHQLFAVGYAGILYPPHILPPTAFDCDVIISTALYADDLWLKANEVVNDIPVALATLKTDQYPIGDSQNTNLLKYNKYQGGNEEQFSLICEYFDNYYNSESLIQNKLFSSSRFFNLTGQPPLIDLIQSLTKEANKVTDLSIKLKEANAKKAEWYNKLHALYKVRDDLSSQLKEANAKRAEWYNKLHDLYKVRDNLSAELKEANTKGAEWYNKLHELYKEVDDLSAKLKEANAKITEYYNALQMANEENTELNSKLKQTYKDKSEINKKLQTTYTEKSEINRKLQQTYAEKSEVNKKLQITYVEKSERGVQIKTQQETIKELNEELANIQKSWTYRIGRFFTWPVRKLRAIRNKSK